MKICAACHEDLPKDSYSKKQWKLDKCQRRCKVCITNNREVQPPQNSNTNEITKSLDSMYLEDVEKISDEELFKQPPPKEDCPICFLRMPTLHTGERYKSCCGKLICSGCIHAVIKTKKTAIPLCPFCRVPTHTTEEEGTKRYKALVEAGDLTAIRNLGVYHRDGILGFKKEPTKAFELFVQAAELDFSGAYCCIGFAYENGGGVKVDKKKALYYYKLAAIGGDEVARNNLGNDELLRVGNMDRALKHYMLAVGGGYADSLKVIKQMYTKGDATKEDYTKALQTYQVYLGEIKSRQRDEAAAYSEELYRYY